MTGAVLAGGASRRMGFDKAELKLDGVPLWRRQMDVLSAAGATRVVLIRRPGQAIPGNVEIRYDRVADAGPMAGLQAALESAPAGLVAVLAVDMPGIDAAWFTWLHEFCRPGRGAMARHAEACEPLAAIYPVEALGEVSTRLVRGDGSLQRLATALAAADRMTLVDLLAAQVARCASANTVLEGARHGLTPAVPAA